MRFNKKLVIVFVLLAVIAATAFYVWAEDKRQRKQETILEELERFGRVLGRVVDYYIEEKDSGELIDAAIDGMLKELDPHSVYLDKHQYENLMIDTKGKFGGLGMTISARDGFPTVISPLEGTPASRLGIQGGDRIVEIEGVSTKGWSSEKAVSKLRGKPGTQVNITIGREGLEDSLRYTITRALIEVPSITYWDIIDEVGYVRIVHFAERTARDLNGIISEFEQKGIKGLILDLRSNPGGLLEAAWSVSELFLDRDNLIVYTESRILRHNKKYVSNAKIIHEGYPVVILVNGASASASEIVAGALQDWDKALIVGQTTFGKGSVQTVFNIDGSSALKLTTAKYFTPSGRSIQRDELSDDTKEVADNAEAEREEFLTSGGRTVYGGGGITPDWEMELHDYTELQRKLELRSVFFSYAVHFTAYHEVDESFEVTPDVMSDFKEYLKTQDIEMEDKEWDEKDIKYVKLAIKREVFRKLYGTKGAYIATLSSDEEVAKVMEMFRQAPTLSEMFDYVERKRNLAKAEEQ
ncbi:MAG: S41 family peptidase [Candidatus Krumholzibacteria bacterium]|nr:S41 family peptidase [Candidatus Krumholzibacteria bacterium]